MHAVAQYQDGLKQLMKQLDDDERRFEAAPNTKRPLVIREKSSTGRTPQRSERHHATTRTTSNTETRIAQPGPLPRTVGLSELRSYLDNMLIEVHQLLKADLYMLRYWKSSGVSSMLLEKKNEAITKFRESLALFERSMPPDAVAVRNHGITGSKSMLGVVLQVKVAMIMLKTSVDCPTETTFDQFGPQFEEIVSRSESLTAILERQQVGAFDPINGSTSMQLGISYPLFFVACKCRDWSLRRRAIKQLMKCGKDGSWEGSIMARVAQRVVELEERGLQPNQVVPETSRIHEVKKHVDHHSQTVRVEYRLAQDASWKHWTTLREVIKF